MQKKNLRLLPSLNWQAVEIVHFDDGSKKRVYATGATPAEARQAVKNKIEKVKEERKYGKAINEGEITLGKTIENYIEQMKNGDILGYEKRDTSIEADVRAYEKLIKPFPIAKKKLKDIHVVDCMDWQEQVNRVKARDGKKTLSASFKNRAYTLMKKVIDRYTARMEVRSPMDSIDRWRVPTKSRIEMDNSILSMEDLRKLVGYCLEHKNDKDGKPSAILIILFCYCRSGEALALQKRDCHHKGHEHEIFINRTIIKHHEIGEDGRTKTRDSVRYAHLPPVAEEIINIRLGMCKKDKDLLFRTVEDKVIDTSSLNTYFKRLLRRLKIDAEGVHLHNLRAMGITYTQALEGDSHGVERRAGHSSIQTTEQYYTGVIAEQISSADRAADNFANQCLAKTTKNG